MKKIVALFLSSFVLVQCAKNKENNTTSVEHKSLETLLKEYNECINDAEDDLSCKEFTAYAICSFYKHDGLKKEGNYIKYHDIYSFIEDSNDWDDLGSASDNDVLIEAQKLANEGHIVLAIKTEDKYPLPVLIVPGELSQSQKWGGKVPNSTAFFPIRSGMKSYINKTLNYAWRGPEGIEIYVMKK